MTAETTTNLEPFHFAANGAAPCIEVTSDWTKGLPVFKSRRVIMRELVKADATTLLSMLTSEEVAKFISPPPTTPEGFEKFIQWAIRERQAGKQMMFGIVPEGYEHAVGLVQIRAIAPRFSVAEWGFALGSPFWGTGLFLAGARTAVDFAFNHTDVHRLEARAAVHNHRGNGALRKLGAVQECILRGSLLKNGQYLDQFMWSILASDWFQMNTLSSSWVS